MKKATQYPVFLFIVFCLVLASCQPSKQVVRANVQIDKLKQDSINAIARLNECNAQLAKLTDEKTALINENADVMNELKDLSSISKLTIAEQAKRLKSLQSIIQTQKQVMANLKNAIADALINYTTDELYVYVKDGNVYVSLEEKLLFKSGSDVVDPKGKEALKTLSKVLNSAKDITVLIEGHTDSVPITTNQFKDNWDLSTARATSIVRILTIDNGFDPNRITASGRSLYHPIKSNETAEGRASNRRTEVIITPDLKELFTALFQ